jgi:hypothetical protein
MDRVLWTGARSVITVNSLLSWVFYMSDFSSDVTYILTVPKSNELLLYVMLISLVLPSILNFLWLSWKIGNSLIKDPEELHQRILIGDHSKRKGLCAGICGGLKFTVAGLLGFQDLFIVTGSDKYYEKYENK